MKKRVALAIIGAFIYIFGIMAINELLAHTEWRFLLIGIWFLPFYFYFMKVNKKPSRE